MENDSEQLLLSPLLLAPRWYDRLTQLATLFAIFLGLSACNTSAYFE